MHSTIKINKNYILAIKPNIKNYIIKAIKYLRLNLNITIIVASYILNIL